MRRLGFAAVLLPLVSLLLLPAGCKKTKKDAPEDGTAASSSPTPSRPLTADDLQPVIREIGASGVVPKAVVIEFSSRVTDEGASVSDKTVVKITPDTPGRMEWTSPSTLTYTPRNGFLYATKYSVALEAVETRSGVVAAPSAGAWSREFTTPAFAFVRASPASIDFTKNKVNVDLAFSGPVSASAVRDFVTFQADGANLGDAKISSTENANVVRATLVSSRLSAKAKIRVKVRAGLAPEGKSVLRAAAAEESFELFDGEPVEVKTSLIKEGGNGFYVEVVCNDKAAEGGERYYWDYEAEQSWYVSRRCMLQEAQAQEGIRFDPPVKFYVAPGSAGFRVFGDFKRGTYAMTIDAGVGSVDGGVTQASFEKSFSVPARKPAVSFVSNGRYLPRNAWRNLAINHLNIDAANLFIRHVPPENLVYWMSDDYRENTDERTSNLVVAKTIAVKGAPDAMTTTWIDVASWLPADTKGVLELSLEAPGAQRNTARLLLTEMSIVAKKGASDPKEPWKEEVRVWAMGMEESNLLSGVEMKLVRKSGLVVAKCTTSGEEGCTLKADRPDEDKHAPFAIIATKGGDLTYLKYSDLRTDVADSDVQGVPWVTEQAYRAAVWSDRGVYRPGETAHIAATLRGRNDEAPDPGLPVELKLIDPREKVARKLVLKTNEAGVLTSDLSFPAFADTGSWRVELAVGEKTVGSYGFNVEEFVPERMKVTATTSKPGYSIDDSVPVGVDAKYLFGGSADGSSVEITCRLEPTTFKPKENGNYAYGVWRDQGEKAKTVTLGQVTGTLDEKGHADIECPSLESGAGFLGAARLVADAAVFEAGSGRSTNGQAFAPVHPEAFYLGLLASGKAEKGKPIKVEGVVVDWEGKISTANAPKDVTVEIYRLESEYGYYYDEGEGEERYQRWLRPVRESASTAAVSGGKFSLTATPSEDNDGFIVRVMSGGARTDVQLEGSGRSWYWSYNERSVDQTPKPLKPTALAIEVPKLAKVGESITVKVKAPYRGKILFTAETKTVVADEWKKADAGEVSWTFKLKEFAPTVYVSAFLVKDPHLESKESFLPDRAFGVEPIAVEPTAYTQTVEMTVPESVRSNSKLTVTLDLGKVEAGTYATVAAVDEGILSLTKFKSPDPIAEIFAKRRLGVETFETVGWTMLLPPQKSPQRGTGGDAEGGAAGRVQPVKPVALWSGLVKVPDDGKLTVSFDVPQYRGALRVMAVTSGPKKLGRASKQVVVKDPIVLTTTLPRFVTLGDEIQIPVFVTNLSGAKLDVDVSLTAENLPYPGLEQPADAGSPIQFLGKPRGTASIEDGKSATMVFHARAIKAIGAAKFRVTAKGGGHESREELDVPFLPAGPKSRVVQKIPLEKGEKDIAAILDRDGWLPTSEKSTVWVTSNPYGESFDHLTYLVRYPYGCIEQTTSSTRPLLFVSNIIGSVDPTLVADGKIDDMIMSGVNRVLSMQTPSGGFSYWPGDTEPSGWGSAYATHMLFDAQKAGYSVPQDRLDEVVEWISREATKYENEGRDERYDWHGDTEAYMQYVLAIGGKGRKARIQKLIDGLPAKASEEKAEQKYMLQAALWLAGDRRYEKDLKAPDLSAIKDTRHNSWSFYSDRRRRGFMLSTFQDLFGNDPAGEPLAQSVASALSGHTSGYYTTQELVWGVTGLGKRVKDSTGDFSPPTLTANGKGIEPKALDKKLKTSDRTWALARASEYKSLSLNVADKGKGSLFLMLSSEGVKETPDYRVGGDGLKVHRVWRDAKGGQVDPNGLNLADLVYVEIDVTNTTSEKIQNIALVDRLPAGFEIENPRLGRGGATDWIDEESKWSADYMNLRDDRIELFGSIGAGETRTFVYAARVVTAGEFTIPPVEAEAMYDPRIWAREDGRKITISGPWKDYLL